MFRARIPSLSAVRLLLLGAFAAVGASCATVSAAAEDAARRATGREVGDRVDRSIGGAADRAEDAVRGDDDDEAASAPSSSRSPATTPAESEPAASGPGSDGRVRNANVGFDFEPGERVLFADDFSDENVGDFPSQLTWARGNMEVVEWEGRRLLRASSASALTIDLGEDLPEQFTLEMVMHVPTSGSATVLTGALPGGPWGQDYAAVNFGSWRGSGLYDEAGNPLAVNSMEPLREAVIPVRIMMDGTHLKVYQGDRRIANVPQIEFPRTNQIHLLIDARDDRLVYLGDIRVAGGGRDLYDVLAREGRFTARGIEFDTGSDRIRSTSRAALDEIGEMLQAHPNLSLVVEGHTDDQGAEASNLDLSERRAASVRAYLIENYGVDAGRLEARGFGESRPVADNDTPEGRQSNRRVELVRAS